MFKIFCLAIIKNMEDLVRMATMESFFYLRSRPRSSGKLIYYRCFIYNLVEKNNQVDGNDIHAYTNSDISTFFKY